MSLEPPTPGKGQKPDFLSGDGDDDFPVSTEAAKRKAPLKSKKREMKVRVWSWVCLGGGGGEASRISVYKPTRDVVIGIVCSCL